MRRLFKQCILETRRYRTSVGRAADGLRLDRNERVEDFTQAVVSDMLGQFTGADLCAYPDANALYLKLAEFMGLDVGQLYVVNGITDGIRILFETLCRPGDNVVVLDPTYPMYAVQAQLTGVELRGIPFDAEFRPRLDLLPGLIDGRTAFVAIANPNLPVECALRASQLDELARLCAANESVFVVDEAYHYFGAEGAVGLLPRHENLVVMRTFSKAFGLASIRVGWMMACPELIDYLSKTRSLVESNTLSMGIACHALDHVGLMERYVGEVAAGARLLRDALVERGIRFHGGEVSNGMLVFLHDRAASEDCLRFMAERRIYIRGSFDPPFDNCIRVTIGGPPAMAAFLSAFDLWRKEAGHG